MLKLLPLLLLVACGSIHVNEDYNNKKDFSSMKYYRWVANTDKSKDALIRDRVKKAVNENLMTKGYMIVTNGEADFLVDYVYEEPPYPKSAGVNTGVGLGLGSRGFSTLGVGFGSGHRVLTEKLTIEMLDPNNNDVLWKGGVVEKLKDSTPEETSKNFDQSIHAIIEKFPPKA